AVRGSAGSVFRVPIRTNWDLPAAVKTLTEQSVQVLAAAVNSATNYTDVDWMRSSALVVGQEGSGFRSDDLELFSLKVQIPMNAHIQSLNVATASAVYLFEAVRQTKLRHHGSRA